MSLDCQKDAFNLEKETCYLNGAYMSPLLKKVESAGHEWVSKKCNPQYITIDDFFSPVHNVRSLFSQLIQNPEPNRIAIIPSVSYAMANVANNIKFEKGDEIIIVGEQFPSNYYIWQRMAKLHGAVIKIIHPDAESNERGKSWNQAILNAINPSTKLVTMPIVHWADGTRFDIKTIREKTSMLDCLLVVDGTQSIGAIDFDVSDIRVDALIVASYKWCLGPYSMGAAYYGTYFDEGIPIEESWMSKRGSENFKDLANYNAAYQDGAIRYDVGESSNFILINMFNAALQQLLEWCPNRIEAYNKSITAGPITKLQESGFVIDSPSFRADHLFGIRLLPQMNMDGIKHKLHAEHIFVSYRGDAIRVSPNVYNTEEDLLQMVDILRSCL